MMHLYARCAACRKEKFFVRTRKYVVPRHILAKNPHLGTVNGMTSDGVLCGKCFRGIRKATLGV